MKITEFPKIDTLVNLTGPLDPFDHEVVENWHALSPELRAMVPYVAQLIAEGIGGQSAWSEMNASKRNVMSYSALALLAEARKRAIAAGYKASNQQKDRQGRPPTTKSKGVG